MAAERVPAYCLKAEGKETTLIVEYSAIYGESGGPPLVSVSSAKCGSKHCVIKERLGCSQEIETLTIVDNNTIFFSP